MAEFRTIEIDFDIHKAIESARQSFAESPNDVLRRLLSLGERSTPSVHLPITPEGARPWSEEGVLLPHGTQVRMRYNGRLHEGKIIDGKWVLEGNTFSSPSGAASGVAVTKKGRSTRLDGWNYWETKTPGENAWTRLATLRQKANGTWNIDFSDLDLGGLDPKPNT